MAPLKGYQRKYLRGLAHALKPVVQVGQKGLTDGVLESVAEALDLHELVKVKFLDHKEKERKAEFAEIIETKAGAALAGMIGHTAIFFRPQDDPEKRKIVLPEK
jgi:RNA-binding protein